VAPHDARADELALEVARADGPSQGRPLRALAQALLALAREDLASERGKKPDVREAK
jgi:hypothetical protein